MGEAITEKGRERRKGSSQREVKTEKVAVEGGRKSQTKKETLDRIIGRNP